MCVFSNIIFIVYISMYADYTNINCLFIPCLNSNTSDSAAYTQCLFTIEIVCKIVQ